MLSDFFKHVFCINLDKRPDKWESVVKEFHKIGLEGINRVSGVDGNPDAIPTRLLPGEVGCVLSHLNIIKKAKELKLPNILVFEDDVAFHNDFTRIFDLKIGNVPANWDMLYFCGNHQHGHTPVADGVVKVLYTFTTNAYAMKHTLYDHFINELPKLLHPVDVTYAKYHRACNAYCFMPHLAWQQPGISDIHNVYSDYKFLKHE